MKKLITISILAALLAAGTTAMAQERKEDYLGLPGDNLNLYAVMKIFQESKTLEEFERVLNEENSRINNLDLNGDQNVDYISVFDNVDGNIHNIVMQVAINERERQDVAVFTVVRDTKGNVLIQLTGDEELYGQNYIIEPIFDDSVNGQTANPGYVGNANTINGQNVTVVRTTTYEIAEWPVIRFIYLPSYLGWRSSWYWGYYPSYWRPWRPFYWHYYYGYHYNWYNDYYGHYRRWDNHRHPYWRENYYSSSRVHSTYVNVNIQNGQYRSTYSRPEQRRDGEALYKSTQKSTSSRRPDNSSISNGSRRSVGTANSGTRSAGPTNSAARRAENSSSNRSVVKPSTERSNSSVRRTEVGTNRSTGSQAEGKSNSNARRLETGSTTRNVGEVPSRARASESRSQVQSKPAETRARQSSSSKSAAPAKRETKARESSSRSKQTQTKSSDTKRERR